MPSLQRRNYPQFPIDLAWFGNDASTNYCAIQIKAEKRFSHGLQFLAHYTYSHADDFDSSYYSVNPKVANGPDPFSRNSVFVINAVYLLPFGKSQRYFGNASRAMDLLVGGWQLSQTLNWSSALPWTPSMGECSSVTDAGPCRANFLSGQSVNVGPRQVNGQKESSLMGSPFVFFAARIPVCASKEPPPRTLAFGHTRGDQMKRCRV